MNYKNILLTVASIICIHTNMQCAENEEQLTAHGQAMKEQIKLLKRFYKNGDGEAPAKYFETEMGLINNQIQILESTAARATGFIILPVGSLSLAQRIYRLHAHSLAVNRH
jgi:hypothetical protein